MNAVFSLSIDPVLTSILCATLSVILLIGAGQKLRDLELFRAVVENYRLAPESLEGLVAIGLPILEVIAGLTILFDSSRTFGAALALLLLGLVTGAVIINLVRGRRKINCGCGGPDGRQTLSWGLVLRNAILVIGVSFGAVDGRARDLFWVDYLTVGFGTVALFGLYMLVNQLLANHPRLMGLRTSI